MSKVMYIFIGFLLAIAAAVAIGNVYASGMNRYPTPTSPPIPTEVIEPTIPPVIVASPTIESIFPTATIEPIFPSATVAPGSKVTIVPPKKNKHSTNTPTPTGIVLLVEGDDCPGDCMCLIVTQLAIGNDLQRTQIANEARVCVQP